MSKKSKQGRGGREIGTEYKLLVVRERLKGTPEKDVAAAFGVSAAAVAKWTSAFRRHGPSALESKRGKPGRTGLRPLKTSAMREQVVELKREHEDWGSRRIRDVLARFAALGISEQQVRRILHDEGLIKERVDKPEREHPPRRFERATPNQLWQSDIFTFRLRRAERLYVCVFMDDHSRFIVGHALAHHQLERQNREHRAWERELGPVTRDELAASLPSMRTALNALWARPTLDWCTAETAWERREALDIDRRELHADVERRTSGLATAGIDRLRAQRLAIESALTERGLLTINQGGWC